MAADSISVDGPDQFLKQVCVGASLFLFFATEQTQQYEFFTPIYNIFFVFCPIIQATPERELWLVP